MNGIIKIQMVKYAGFTISILVGILILIFISFNDFFRILFAIVAMLITALVFLNISNYLLIRHIRTSANPRKEFWNLFRKGVIDEEMLENIPKTSYWPHQFSEEYLFYDRASQKTKKRICLQLTNQYIKFKDACDLLITYPFDKIKDLKVRAQIDVMGSIADEYCRDQLPKLILEIVLKNNISANCDLMNIDCEIDELEQIIEHFLQTKIKKTNSNQ